MYLWLANLIAIFHGLLVVSISVGTVSAITGLLRHAPRLERLYYVALACTAFSQFAYGECILTVWEKMLRNKYFAGSAYHTSCLRHYLPWLPTVVLQWVGPSVIVIGVLCYPLWRYHDRRLGDVRDVRRPTEAAGSQPRESSPT